MIERSVDGKVVTDVKKFVEVEYDKKKDKNAGKGLRKGDRVDNRPVHIVRSAAFEFVVSAGPALVSPAPATPTTKPRGFGLSVSVLRVTDRHITMRDSVMNGAHGKLVSLVHSEIVQVGWLLCVLVF